MKSKHLIGIFSLLNGMVGEGRVVMGSGRGVSKSVKAKEQELMLRRGLKGFIYKGEIIYAINQKNADRKAKKKGLI